MRTHPQLPGRYMVNRGERRVRAARKAGLLTVPAFIDERVDPFAQAAENLHREDMSPFDLAAFVRAREKEGLSKSEIARRLGKPRSYISEAAALIDAPERGPTCRRIRSARLRRANPPPAGRCGTRLSGAGRGTAGGGHADQSGQHRHTARRGAPDAIARRIAGPRASSSRRECSVAAGPCWWWSTVAGADPCG